MVVGSIPASSIISMRFDRQVRATVIVITIRYLGPRKLSSITQYAGCGCWTWQLMLLLLSSGMAVDRKERRMKNWNKRTVKRMKYDGEKQDDG